MEKQEKTTACVHENHQTVKKSCLHIQQYVKLQDRKQCNFENDEKV